MTTFFGKQEMRVKKKKKSAGLSAGGKKTLTLPSRGGVESLVERRKEREARPVSNGKETRQDGKRKKIKCVVFEGHYPDQEAKGTPEKRKRKKRPKISDKKNPTGGRKGGICAVSNQFAAYRKRQESSTKHRSKRKKSEGRDVRTELDRRVTCPFLLWKS